MASPFQQQVRQRKLLYLGLILVLLTLSVIWRYSVIDGLAERLAVREQSRGEVELTGAVVRLGLTGSRGLATCVLWANAIEKQKKNQWNELEVLARTLMRGAGSRLDPLSGGSVASHSELDPFGQLERRDEPSELLLLLAIEIVRLGLLATHLEVLEVRRERLLDAVAVLSHAPHPLPSLVFVFVFDFLDVVFAVSAVSVVIVCSRSDTYACTLITARATYDSSACTGSGAPDPSRPIARRTTAQATWCAISRASGEGTCTLACRSASRAASA